MKHGIEAGAENKKTRKNICQGDIKPWSISPSLSFVVRESFCVLISMNDSRQGTDINFPPLRTFAEKSTALNGRLQDEYQVEFRIEHWKHTGTGQGQGVGEASKFSGGYYSRAGCDMQQTTKEKL